MGGVTRTNSVVILGGGPGPDSALAQARPASPPTDRPVIEARGLTKRFGDFTAADNITFEGYRPG